MSDLVSRARALAEASHEGQLDKSGAAYIGHPARVARNVEATGFGPEAQAVAWLHDVVEDTDVTLSDLAKDFPFAVVDAVNAISKRKGEKFSDYYDRVKANHLALVVKWFDVADNSSPERLAKVAPDTRDRLRTKYEEAKKILLDQEIVDLPR